MNYDYNQGGMGMPPAPRQTSTSAIISLIAGLLGLSILPIIGGLVAIFTGSSAKKAIRASGGMIGGGGMATAGVIMGWISLILGGLTACGVTIAIGLPICLAALAIPFSWDSIFGYVPVLLALI
jgi:hypothetical protein